MTLDPLIIGSIRVGEEGEITIDEDDYETSLVVAADTQFIVFDRAVSDLLSLSTLIAFLKILLTWNVRETDYRLRAAIAADGQKNRQRRRLRRLSS